MYYTYEQSLQRCKTRKKITKTQSNICGTIKKETSGVPHCLKSNTLVFKS